MATDRNSVVDGPTMLEIRNICMTNIFSFADSNASRTSLNFTFEDGTRHELVITSVEARGNRAILLGGSLRDGPDRFGQAHFKMFYRPDRRRGDIIERW